MNLKYLFTLIISMLFALNLSAQDECDCPEIDYEVEGICLTTSLDTLGFTLWAPDECYAACWFGEDYTIVDCDIDWEWEDECDCPEEDWETDGVCLEFSEGGSTWNEWAPSECYAACWYEDFTIVDCDEVDWGWEDECDCPEEDWQTDGICIEISGLELDSLGLELDTLFTTWVPSECYAACWFETYTVVECEEIDWEWEDECDCPEEDWEAEGVCIELADGWIDWAPSECYATCWYGEDYTIVDCDEIDWGWEDDCDCPEEDWEAEGICISINDPALDSLGFELDSLEFVTWVPSLCYADCWYEDYVVIDCIEWDNGGECDWDLECECELDTDEGICIAYISEQDTLIEWVPNECFADCWGFENYAVVDCEDFWDWEEEDEIDFEGDLGCVTELLTSEVTTLQAFIIGLAECGAFELDECVLEAPIFETDQEFLDYLSENCPDWFGFIMDESEGPSLLKQFGEVQGNGPTNTTEVIEALDVKLLGNPVVDRLDIQMDASEGLNIKMTLRTLTGSMVLAENVVVNKGSQVYSVATSELAGGTYIMTMTSEKGVQALKFVVAK